MSTRGFGIKAYGTWTRFEIRASYEKYLNEWIAGTDGAERDRAVRALNALYASGAHYFDSDTNTTY